MVETGSLRSTEAAILGLRVDQWLGWFGLAVDVSRFEVEARRQTISATARLRFDKDAFGNWMMFDPEPRVPVDLPRAAAPTTVVIAPLVMLRVPTGTVEPMVMLVRDM